MDDLKTGKVPPPAFVRAGLIPQDAMYAVERGVYGLREAPKRWADARTKDLKKVQSWVQTGSGLLPQTQMALHAQEYCTLPPQPPTPAQIEAAHAEDHKNFVVAVHSQQTRHLLWSEQVGIGSYQQLSGSSIES
eukprot:5115697-Amphidinium_carterae.2